MELFNNAILNTEKLSEPKEFDDIKKVLHIGFGIDSRFALGMGVLMTSIMLNNPNQNIAFHVFTDGLEKSDIERLQVLAQNERVDITIYYINLEVFLNFPTASGWSHATYYRFIMGEKLYGLTDKMLYLDADILCVGSLQGLLETDMGNNIILGIDDYMTDFDARAKKLSIHHGRYFNAGVMYIDVNKWHAEKIADRAVQLIMENPQKYEFLDQDVLNVLLDGKTRYVDKKWDHIYNMSFMKHKLPEDTILIHYTGDKPWQRWTEHHFMVERYYEYIKRSPWSDVSLTEPVHYKEMSKMAKSYKRRGMYLQYLKFYCEYLILRTKTKLNS